MNKKCPKCNNLQTKKDWKRNWRQSYRCKLCKHVFQNKTRLKSVLNDKIYKSYVHWKQTYEELWEKYSLSWRTIKKRIDSVEFKKKT